MNRLSLRALVVGVLMVCTALFAQWARPTAYLSDRIGKPHLETLFPERFGDWRLDNAMAVIQPSPDVQAVLDSVYTQVLSRTYVNGAGQRIMLSVAYGGEQSNGTRAHRPEVCYPAQGFQITYSGKGDIALGQRSVPVRQLMSRMGGRNEPITYWIVVGGVVASSHWDQRAAELRYSLQGLIADGLLVRVSSIDPDMARGFAVQSRFLQDLAGAVTPQAGARIFGTSAY